MTDYFVSRHSRESDGVQKFGITAKTSRGKLAAGSVIMKGDDVLDVRTDAGAKCFRGTESYDVRKDAVERFLAEWNTAPS